MNEAGHGTGGEGAPVAEGPMEAAEGDEKKRKKNRQGMRSYRRCHYRYYWVAVEEGEGETGGEVAGRSMRRRR